MATHDADADAEDDFGLLRAWGEGDRPAGETLVRRYYDRILRYFEMRVTAEAEDLTQRTFLACVQAARSDTPLQSFRAYVFGVARRQYQAYQRRDGRRESAMRRLSGAGQGPGKTSMSTIVSRAQEQQLLLAAMSRLSDDMSTTVQLFYWEGMKALEIGEVLGVTESAVTTRLNRARAQLRENIATLVSRPKVRQALLDRLEDWTRSLIDPDATPPSAAT